MPDPAPTPSVDAEKTGRPPAWVIHLVFYVLTAVASGGGMRALATSGAECAGKADLEEIRKDVGTVKTDVASLQAKLGGTEDRYRSLEARLDKLGDKIDDLRRDLRSARDDR